MAAKSEPGTEELSLAYDQRELGITIEDYLGEEGEGSVSVDSK